MLFWHEIVWTYLKPCILFFVIICWWKNVGYFHLFNNQCVYAVREQFPWVSSGKLRIPKKHKVYKPCAQPPSYITAVHQYVAINMLGIFFNIPNIFTLRPKQVVNSESEIERMRESQRSWVRPSWEQCIVVFQEILPQQKKSTLG